MTYLFLPPPITIIFLIAYDELKLRLLDVLAVFCLKTSGLPTINCTFLANSQPETSILPS